jgi:hypothetical protein
VDFGVEVFVVFESHRGEVVGFQVSPDGFDVVEFGGVFGQPLNVQPMEAGGQGRARELSGVNGAVIEDQGVARRLGWGP